MEGCPRNIQRSVIFLLVRSLNRPRSEQLRILGSVTKGQGDTYYFRCAAALTCHSDCVVSNNDRYVIPWHCLPRQWVTSPCCTLVPIHDGCFRTQMKYNNMTWATYCHLFVLWATSCKGYKANVAEWNEWLKLHTPITRFLWLVLILSSPATAFKEEFELVCTHVQLWHTEGCPFHKLWQLHTQLSSVDSLAQWATSVCYHSLVKCV